MADDLTAQSAALATIPAGAKIATDDVAGSHHQRVKLDVGGDGLSVPVVGAVPAGGQAATDAPVSGSPLQDGGRASYPVIPPAMSADGDVVPAWLDRSGAMIVRKRPVATYSAAFRLADATAGARALSYALTANTDKQIATIYHTAGSTKRVQIKYVAVFLVGNSTAAQFEFEIQSLSAATAPATGNPAIVPGSHDQADGAAEATCLAIPTTAGSVVAANSPVGYGFDMSWGVFANDTSARPITPIVLWDSRADGDGKDLIMRAGVAEGYAVISRANAGEATMLAVATIVFTEE